MGKKAKPKTLRQLGAGAVENQDIPEILEEIRQASDRTAAIVLASWVERSLEQRIIDTLPRHDEQTVRQLQNRDGALSSFFGKIHLGFALGLYDAGTRDNLDVIRRIRNAFAHTALAIHFETQQVIDDVRKLKAGAFGTPSKLGEFSEYRKQFTTVCVALVVIAQLKAVGYKMEIVKSVIDAINPHLPEGKKVPSEVSEKLGKAVDTMKNLKE